MHMQNVCKYPFLSDFQIHFYKTILPHYKELASKKDAPNFIKQHVKDIEYFLRTGKFYDE